MKYSAGTFFAMSRTRAMAASTFAHEPNHLTEPSASIRKRSNGGIMKGIPATLAVPLLLVGVYSRSVPRIGSMLDRRLCTHSVRICDRWDMRVIFEIRETGQLLCHAQAAIRQSHEWLNTYLLKKRALEQRRVKFDSMKFSWRDPRTASTSFVTQNNRH